MQKVVNLDPKKHIYELDNCSGCSAVIEGDYMEIGLPSYDGKEVKHIALCGSCSSLAKGEGVI